MSIYIDTSALAKRYIAERGSDEFEAFVQAEGADCVICQLATVELESVLRRLQRERLIDSGYALQVRRDFASDLASALWSMQAFDAACFARANELLRALDSPLAALDALHLASAVELGCDALATADRQLARAAAECGLTVHIFD
ncbi:MAG: type II toxin-antitoxin system VapC family toxin [Ideonella sp.]|nr:type II toxin-antitoxin system VapC family toxin [Ideonella sp.]MCC7456204.1 type II toxin-antitoxin system VapC family toxin [Nitrospira sp.]